MTRKISRFLSTNGRANNFCECLREHVQPLSVKQFENQRIYVFEHSIRYAGGVSFSPKIWIPFTGQK